MIYFPPFPPAPNKPFTPLQAEPKTPPLFSFSGSGLESGSFPSISELDEGLSAEGVKNGVLFVPLVVASDFALGGVVLK